MTNPPSPHPVSPASGLMGNPYLLLTLTTLFWGGNVVAGKLAVGVIEPHALMVLRWTGALLCVLPFGAKPLRRDWPTLQRYWPLLLFYGALGYATFNVLVYVAAHFTSGVNTSIEQATINIFVMLFNFALFRTRVRNLQIVGVVLTIIGIALTATHGDLSRIVTLDVNFGDGLVIAACLIYAIYSICLRYRPQTSWLSFLFVTIIGAILASVVYQVALGGGPAAFIAGLPALGITGWLIVLYTAIFPSVISQMFYVRGVELIGSNRASLFVNLVPLFGTLGSIVVLGEPFEIFHAIAAALVIAGIVLAEWAARR